MKPKGKRGQTLIYGLMAGLIAAFIVSFFSNAIAKKDFGEIGDSSLKLIDASKEAEKSLFYLDQSAKYSAYQTAYDLAQKGGFFKESECGDYFGFTLWQTLDENKKLKQCFPAQEEISGNFKSIFNANLNNYVQIFNQNSDAKIPLDNYNQIKLANKLDITGLANENIIIEIGKPGGQIIQSPSELQDSEGIFKSDLEVKDLDKVRLGYDLKKFIEEVSQKAGVDSATALALIGRESSFTHCCIQPDNNRPGTCRKSDVTSCGLRELYTSGSSYGITQINLKHCAWFNPDLCSENKKPSDLPLKSSSLGCFSGYYNSKDSSDGGWGQECRTFKEAGCAPGQSAKDMECNIKLGITFLKSLYNTYGNNDALYERTVKNYCTEPTQQKRYLDYKEWDRVKRAYNGFGCAGPGADTQYVEKINNEKSTYLT